MDRNPSDRLAGKPDWRGFIIRPAGVAGKDVNVQPQLLDDGVVDLPTPAFPEPGPVKGSTVVQEPEHRQDDSEQGYCKTGRGILADRGCVAGQHHGLGTCENDIAKNLDVELMVPEFRCDVQVS